MAKTDPWIPGNLPTTSKVFRTGGGQYGGFSVRETAGSTATIRLWDNASAASGTLLETISLTANASLREEYKWGVRALNGIYVEIVSGTVEGSIRTN